MPPVTITPEAEARNRALMALFSGAPPGRSRIDSAPGGGYALTPLDGPPIDTTRLQATAQAMMAGAPAGAGPSRVDTAPGGGFSYTPVASPPIAHGLARALPGGVAPKPTGAPALHGGGTSGPIVGPQMSQVAPGGPWASNSLSPDMLTGPAKADYQAAAADPLSAMNMSQMTDRLDQLNPNPQALQLLMAREAQRNQAAGSGSDQTQARGHQMAAIAQMLQTLAATPPAQRGSIQELLRGLDQQYMPGAQQSYSNPFESRVSTAPRW